MYQKRFASASILVVFMLLLSSAGVMAHPPTPPKAPPVTGNGLPTRGGVPVNMAQFTPPAAADDGHVNAQAMALGKPGTVFRYAAQYGVNREAYLADADHLNSPSSVIFDAGGNMYVTEEGGARLLKFDADGEPVWQSGVAGFHTWWAGTGYSWPKDVAIAPDGTLWVAGNDILTHVDQTNGEVLGNFPNNSSPDEDETFFRNLMGIAFDSDGRMYLSDADRQRIQVFTFDGDGNPVYAATIGETDVSDNDNEHFNYPAQVVVDPDGVVYVADVNNYRVQSCEPTGTVWPWGWDCHSYTGTGTPGSASDQVNGAYGLGLDGYNLMIADGGNGRILTCNGGMCLSSQSDPNLSYLRDVGSDPLGGVYAADAGRHVIWKQTVSGFIRHAGTLDEPYATDNQHYYWPHGIEVDAKGNIIILEENGQRMTKLAKNGAFLWSMGTPGVPTYGEPKSVAWPRVVTTDAAGKIYLADDSGVRVFDPNGNPLASMPKDDYKFGWITGIAVDTSGNIYVADAYRNQVVEYNKSFVRVASIGNEDTCGADNQSFCFPMGITLDTARNLYVTDWANHRVQKFDKNHKFLMTFGSGLEGESTGRLNGPVDVAVDAKANVYVAEERNSRVTVFSKTGAFLTMLGGWGSTDGQFLNVGGLSLDKAGNLYVTDGDNSRVQVFSPGVPYWAQVNLNGFGRKENGQIKAMAVFKNQLYAAPSGWDMRGGLIYRLDPAGWTAVVDDGFENPATGEVTALFVYQNYLYAGTDRSELYRTQDGLTWEAVVLNGFDRKEDSELFYPGTLTGKVCVSVENMTSGAELWCSPSGDRGTWNRELSMDKDLGYPDAWQINAIIEYNGATYLTTNNWGGDPWAGVQIWRKIGAGNWTQVNESGFGDPVNNGAHAMAVFTTPQKLTYLYVITEHHTYARQDGKSRVMRCKICDGSDWQDVSPANLPENQNAVPALRVIGKVMYAVIGNYNTGLGVWSTTDGVIWKQVGAGGLGDSGTTTAFSNYSVTVYKNALYIGAVNWNTGAELWKFCPTAKACK